MSDTNAKTLDQYLQEFSVVVHQEGALSLHSGDLLVDIENLYGTSAVKQAADKAGIKTSAARQRLWVARKFPKDSQMRKRGLSFSHLRFLAGTNDPDKWADDAIANNWTAKELGAQIDASNDKVAQDQGQPCAKCEKPLPEEGDIVSFRVGGKRTQRCCSVVCARDYFDEMLMEDDEDPADITDEVPNVLGGLELEYA